jgi:hypothetical protein
LAELSQEIPKELLRLPPEAIDPARGGEFKEELMS